MIFHEILLFAITPDNQCFTKLSSSLNLKKIPLTEIVCLRIVYAELLERSAFVNSSAKLLSVTFITLSSSEV